MRAPYILVPALLLFSATLSGQKEGLAAINKRDLQAYMTFFASDEMKGRETGTPENEIAALYLRTNIMRLGLKPIPETGDYLQKVPLESAEIKDKETYIKVKDASGREIYTTDSIIYLMAPSVTADVTSDFVFAGYGFADSTAGYDDYSDIDVKDKIVLMMTGSPQLTDPDELNSVFNMEIEKNKIMSAFRMGVKAILCVYDPRSKYADAYASGLADMGVGKVGTKMISLRMDESSAPVQIAFITRNAADNMLKKSGYTIKEIAEKIVSEKKPHSLELSDISVTFRTYIEKKDIEVNNIIGIVEGSDPVLKSECVIYTAHFDHVGVNKEGAAFNGADDNASGSMALLEVAQAFMNLKKKPMRTIIFAWVNGEEKGLLGSYYYASNPVMPLEKTLIDINLDMVGRSRMPSDTGKFMGMDTNVSQAGEIQLFTDQKGNDILDLIKSTSKEAGIKTINMGKDPMIGSSDYASFMAKGVPAIFFNSGDYPDLHTIRDDVEKIDFDKMERVSKMVFLIGLDLANQKKRFVPVTIK
jgi:hypothetical protein